MFSESKAAFVVVASEPFSPLLISGKETGTVEGVGDREGERKRTASLYSCCIAGLLIQYSRLLRCWVFFGIQGCISLHFCLFVFWAVGSSPFFCVVVFVPAESSCLIRRHRAMPQPPPQTRSHRLPGRPFTFATFGSPWMENGFA